MFEKLITVFKIPELRRKIVLTATLLAVYRMGFWVPLPIVDQQALADKMENLASGGGIGQALQIVQLFSASNIGMSTIFGLGIMPYISASIIFQLMGSVYPPLEKLQKEGESGRKKINEYTRYATVVLCLIQSYFWVKTISGWGTIIPEYNGFFGHMVATITMTAGTIFLMWIGEQIDEYGIGNGISLLIMAGILARMPDAAIQLLRPAMENGIALGSDSGIEKLLVLAVLFVVVVGSVVFMTQGQRKIPTQSAKHVRGRRVYGGQRQFLPLRVNQAGVMPIIFASSLLMIPMIGFGQLAKWFDSVIWSDLAAAFSGTGRGFLYNLSYVGLIYFFCYFWTAITFNPKDMANNLKDYGSFIPGYRPGKRTAEYLERVMVRITYVGAAFLAVVAVIPTVIASVMGIDFMVASFFGGTGLLIVVSVALDLVQKIDSHLVMRNYSGLLDSDDSRAAS
ncbi:preprotein translocase subunit SecY [Symmachiella dynata]|uniref:Protein translocase subunit SecY n=1 Tax=Symmachiella dynata TaxID=2527995 RepID=A0A517ZWL3_9PLAN|nr:preprotein translocase subunit SecY [Symmachiella dynata]QDU46887.1 Protein translocase subunit SecY [Symmachiella dynata]